MSCRPHYLPRKFSSILFIVVYLPPQTDSGTNKKSCYTVRRTDKASIQDWYWILLHQLWRSSDVAGLENYYRLQRDTQLWAAQWREPTRWAKCFYARFKARNTEAFMRAPAVPDNCVIKISVADVSKTIKQANIHKPAGPDSVHKACTDQLASVFTDIFNLSMTESVKTTCF